MPPRFQTNPAPLTESAKEARKSFFCELCQKGYSRMNEFEAHESSYDHQHKRRLKEMKQMQKDPNALDRARRAERKADEKSGLISIKPMAEGTGGSRGGFKKGGFKSAFGSADPTPAESKPSGGFKKVFPEDEPKSKPDEDEYDSDDVGYEYYDPARPTGCDEHCAA
ncbi:hypothetical protein P152DRAFT_447103 [Eremomyces bilateralis CBS 781.70]|uniref:C2H2-type domain-containing protein n=1 Tax=Eremomyces bilateralis CBS 781.70 TaxID=1392243 RepID=A0A6G1G9X8_9PEZI|nr:uncharacterized protein P152DRAFT_447103 [Eremomyces bilateralis CBS 781.70]KAF1814802.1 hypothetical protein P152DRAFT_447103 [Eremomyces bilateralis CBS 781.70]